ncbi:MAG: bifunctional hydroxymethylpyrimidine kinase/phosphomethylpyrimidine kinase [Clostridia bacterium]|nr:bifunctional hydroxymethylpyrimidine kinase/phosphomethylpyrimidine kinase [Clostridia bacterium]
MKKVLTIAGSDSSGGAGIQADIKTITMHGMYAMSVITALTAQNTTGVYGVLEADSGFVANQLDCVFSDIRPDSVKIGMVSSAEIIRTIARKLAEHKAENIVLDTVMVSTSGCSLLSDDAVGALITELLPIADIITPNIPEAEVLSGIKLSDRQGLERAARIISGKTKAAILIKGGHMGCDASDYLYSCGAGEWIEGRKINNPNTHGTGCTLSSAIACGLAGGSSVSDSVRAAKDYLTGAIAAGLDLGTGSGPLLHNYILKK